MQAFLLDSVDSTNEAAKRLIREGRIVQSAYVLAGEQTAGKGNHGRTWLSPKGAGIYLTVVDFAPATLVPPSTLFTLAAGVACGEVLRASTGVEVGLKPINDLYVNGRKLGGILTETLIEGGAIRAVLTGIGINVRLAERPVPQGAAEPVSLAEIMGADKLAGIHLDDLVPQIARAVRTWNGSCWRGDGACIRAAWLRLALPGTSLPT